ncbi:hypothetical protein D3C71_648260 [compost metagenome]
MRIDETRNDDFSGNVDFLSALVVLAGADDGVATYGDIRRDEFSGNEVEEASALENHVRRFTARTLVDARFKSGIHAGFFGS